MNALKFPFNTERTVDKWYVPELVNRDAYMEEGVSGNRKQSNQLGTSAMAVLWVCLRAGSLESSMFYVAKVVKSRMRFRERRSQR